MHLRDYLSIRKPNCKPQQLYETGSIFLTPLNSPSFNLTSFIFPCLNIFPSINLSKLFFLPDHILFFFSGFFSIFLTLDQIIFLSYSGFSAINYFTASISFFFFFCFPFFTLSFFFLHFFSIRPFHFLHRSELYNLFVHFLILSFLFQVFLFLFILLSSRKFSFCLRFGNFLSFFFLTRFGSSCLILTAHNLYSKYDFFSFILKLSLSPLDISQCFYFRSQHLILMNNSRNQKVIPIISFNEATTDVLSDCQYKILDS